MRFVFLDVDGTLIDKDDNPRPHIPELIDGLEKLGATIIIWSAGGGRYAELKWNMICNKIYREIEKSYHDKVTVFLWKYWLKESIIVREGKKLCIDDEHYVIDSVEKLGYKGFHVSFYEASLMPDDKELLDALTYAREYYYE